jgi:Protein of unknown function (DUF3617)
VNFQLTNRELFTSWPRIAVLAGTATLSLAALADDYPVLKPGMWEFKRTVASPDAGGKAMNVERRECADPTADMKKSNDTLAKQGCKFSPIVRSGNAYSFSSDCRIQGAQFQSRSVITVDGAGAYRVDVTSTGGGSSTKELLVARRVGECQP